MEINEIKKELYRLKPKAVLESITVDGLRYSTYIGDYATGLTVLFFKVPLNELGETQWFPEMEAKLLIRYLIK